LLLKLSRFCTWKAPSNSATVNCERYFPEGANPRNARIVNKL